MLYALIGLLFAWLGLVLFNQFGTRPAVIGLQAGNRLADCPESPNCACTQATRAEQQIEPIPLTGTAQEAMAAIRSAVDQTGGMRVVTSEGTYLHATASSLVFRFVDDVEFFVDEEQRVIHLRSASRVGYSDMGANARRLAQLRQSILE